MTTEHPDAPPPPPSSPPATAATAPVAVPRRGGPNRFVVFLIGLVIGVLAGGAGGYLLFNGKTVTITNQPQPSASASAAARATPTPTAAPTSPPVATVAPVASGIVPCPVTTPAAQHPLGEPAPVSPGERSDPSLQFCGAGNATIPAGSTRFTTGDNWGLGIADSCPNGSSGQSGMGTVLTVSEVIPGGGAGPDSATEPGDWADSGGVLMAHGGSYQLTVTTVSPSCVWHINIYPAA